MKKLFVSAFCLALFAGMSAQDLSDPKAMKAALKALSSQIKTAKSEATRAENPNFDAARKAVEEAKKSPVAENSAELYNTAALVEYSCFNVERNKPQTGGKSNDEVMYKSAKSAYDYYIKAYELDQKPNAKGKVAPKFKDEIVTNLTNILGSGAFANAAIYYFNDKKDYATAYDYFNLFIDSQKLPLFEGNPQAQAVLLQLGSDETVNQIGFYRAIAASNMKDSKKAIASWEFMKDRNYETNDCYKMLATEYLNLADTAKFEQILVKGAELVPTEPWYSQTLINLYIERKQYDKALTYLDNAIAQEPNNAQFFNIKGSLLEAQELADGVTKDQAKALEEKAMECYKKANELDPNLAGPWANIGRILFNRAGAVEDELFSQKKFDEANRVTEPMYLEALPYLEKAFDLEVDKQTGIGLRQIYYKMFNKPSCPNKAELKQKYNDVSYAIDMEGLK